MSYPISDVTRRVVYSGSIGTGPYSFTFEILANTDIAVYKNTTLLTLTTDYTVTINVDGTGSVTLVTAATSSDNITLVGNRSIERTTDFVTGGDLFANSLNDEFDSLVIFSQQVKETADRGLKAPITDPTDVNMVLPAKASRKGKVLAFDSTSGDPVNGPALDSMVTVIEQSANINTVATNITSVNSAATNMAAIIAAPTQASNAASSASSAASSASSATSSASSAASSAAAAAASTASGMYSAVQDKSANYTVVAGDAGDLLRINTSGGARTITLPQISSVSDGFKIAIVKWTGDGNTVTINRAGSDTINGGTSVTIATQYSQTVLVADFETNTWFASTTGLGATNANVDVFSGNASTTAFTLSVAPGSKNNTYVFVSGVYQQKSTYSLTTTTLTFSAAPPSGTNNVEVIYSTPLPIGTPSDDTVSTAKLQDGALAATVAGLSKMADGFLQATTAGLAKMADGFLAATTAGRAKMADGFVTAAKLASGAAVSNIGAGGITTNELADANVTPAKLSQKITLGTAVNSTSGTAIDFTSIPSWAKRITVTFAGVSLSGTSNLLVQIGAGSVTASGYFGGAWAANTVNTTNSAGFLVTGTNEAARKNNGLMTIVNMGSNTWAETVVTFDNVNNNGGNGGGYVVLGGTLDRLRITSVNGTDTFDAGSINILYEG